MFDTKITGGGGGERTKLFGSATFRSMTIGFCEVLFSFRRHPLFIKRLVQYLKMRELMPALMHKVNSQDSEFDLDVDLNEEKNARFVHMFDY